MTESVVLYEVKDGIAFITLNRPEKRNAVNVDMAEALGEAWDSFNANSEARVALLSARGPIFCAGADIFQKSSGKRSSTRPFINKAWPWNGIKTFKPIVSAVHGAAVGAGYGLAVVHSDITVAAEGTRFMEPETMVGVPARLFEYMPVMPFKQSLMFYLTSEWLTAERAYQIGLVQSLVPAEKLMDEALRIANILKKNAPLTMKAIKYAHYKSMDNIAYKVWRENEEFIKPQVESGDFEEGKMAIKEKRDPNFKGRA